MEELILPIVLTLIKNEPQIQAALVKLFNGTQPTPEDWQAAHDAAAMETFESLAPAAAANLPPPAPAPAPAALDASQAAPVTDQAAADRLKMFGTTDPANATETAAGPVPNPPAADQAAAPAAPEATPFLHPIYGTPVN